MVSKITNTLTSRKFKLAMTKLSIIICTIALAMCNSVVAFADNAENVAPSDAASGSQTMSSLVKVVFWIVRGMILVIGGVPGIIKINQGQTDENPRDRNAGIGCIVVAGLCFGATFVVEKLI